MKSKPSEGPLLEQVQREKGVALALPSPILQALGTCAPSRILSGPVLDLCSCSKGIKRPWEGGLTLNEGC